MTRSRSDDILRIIRASIAHDEQLEIIERLAQRTPNRKPKNTTPVERRDDDRDGRMHGRGSTFQVLEVPGSGSRF